MSYVKLVGTKNPQNPVTFIDLDDGRRVEMGVPIDIPATVKKEWEDRGFVFESSSKSEASETAEETTPAGDVVGSSPRFGDDEGPNQTTNEDDK